MKALVYNGPGLRGWEEAPDPKLQADGDVVVKMTAYDTFAAAAETDALKVVLEAGSEAPRA